MNSNKEYVEATTDELHKNPEWESIYDRYAQELSANVCRYKEKSHKFQVNQPLIVYSTIGTVKTENSRMCYDIRFAGQSVGKIEVDKEGKVTLTVTAKQALDAKKHFKFTDSKELNNVSWNEKDCFEANAFRKFFYGLRSTKDVDIKSEEHRIESFMLQEFSKKNRNEKLLCNIQPIRLGGKFFQLTTPLKASTHEPEISLTQNRNGATGGGIDILARVKHANGEHRIAIIELKDENKESESQKVAMYQAMTYATFIAHLLRSKSGEKWWNIFRDQKNNKVVDEHLHLDVVTLMPVEGKSQEGELYDIDIPKLNVTLHPYTLYYNIDKKGNPCSFQGTLTEVLQK